MLLVVDGSLYRQRLWIICGSVMVHGPNIFLFQGSQQLLPGRLTGLFCCALLYARQGLSASTR